MANEDDLTDNPAAVFLGTDTRTRTPVYLPYADRDLGVALIGKAGTGKSSVLEHLILADLEHGTPGMVIDPHGLLAQRVMQLATPEQADRIILLEASQTVPFGLNLLAVREPVDKDDEPVSWAVDSVVATIKKLYGESDEFLPRLEEYLDLAARTLIPNGGTLADVPRLLRDEDFRRQCLRHVTDSYLEEDWLLYDSLRKGEQAVYSEAVVNRLSRMIRHPVIRSIVGSHETTVPFDQILHGDSMLIVSLPSERLTPERCDFIGAMLLCALADRIFSRKARLAKPPRLHIYLDEYQRFATVTTAELLEQGRKYNAGVALAHQTLYQIPDQRIRNASRHAGTLIVLGVTRPDAEELAGEFPITPREEWVETIEEIDGTEPKLMPSPTSAEDIYIHGHSDPDVDLAARSFFSRPWAMGPTILPPPPGVLHGETKTIPAPPDTRKSAGISPRPGGIKVPYEVKMEPAWVNDFLYEAMTNPRAGDPEVFIDILLGENAHRMFLYSPQSTNEEFMRDGIRPWFMKHLQEENALRNEQVVTSLSGKKVIFNSFWSADVELKQAMCTCGFEDIFYLYQPPTSITDPSPMKLKPVPIDYPRQRLRWLWILWEGIRKNPVLVPSGEQQPRRTKRHIVHGGQTHADALNEFAGQLVHPPERYVAHVRQPQEYHQVKLRPPLGGEAGDGTQRPNPDQPDDIRARSRELYDTSADQARVLPLPPPEQPRRRRVTRSPQTGAAAADQDER